ncbi:MAG: Asp-tRNA(Asn)/Glu-tRNA(Gln) amidotransferase subunit GatB [Elusimicrobiales bacterium]|uniref:Asp-tRNA(Asn)/Glu-tRNA(Gln) amidotransferase subunit GatB n=1 Tax=Candidatus Avelusimicrobium sp. TaxID=3048833 RepID=UPI002701AEF5|nr:Asp-tRNA(Asn)/Glu-tRNA(Gln) amidotransferase subunit GatB [Elusimicrobiales bacterium]
MTTQFEPVIGLEIHVQLASKTKLFCACPNGVGEDTKPNTAICPVCAGHPGVMPVLTEGALSLAVRAGLSMNCVTNRRSTFSRKHYFYPDLPKGYQITQYDEPINGAGYIEITFGPKDNLQKKKIGIHHAHLEEDAAKSSHFADYSLVDYNRAGSPLLEIVSMPDMRSPDEAYAYLTEIKRLMRWVGASNCDMEKGELRVDVNVSLRPVGQEKFGTRAEIKNLNSFKAVKDALTYEINRQTEILNGGGQVKQETRLWDKEELVTKPMRSKEDALDYRYFPEPDLPPVVLAEEWLENVKKTMPELPASKEARFEKAGLSAYDAGVLTSSREISDYFEEVTKSGKVSLKTASNWIQTDLLGMLNAEKKEIQDSPIPAARLAELLEMAESGKINRKQAREVFDEIWKTGEAPAAVVEKRGMVQVSDEGQLEEWAKAAIAANPKAVADYQKGNKAAIGALVGGVMKMSKGKANPRIISQMLGKLLG